MKNLLSILLLVFTTVILGNFTFAESNVSLNPRALQCPEGFTQCQAGFCCNDKIEICCPEVCCRKGDTCQPNGKCCPNGEYICPDGVTCCPLSVTPCGPGGKCGL